MAVVSSSALRRVQASIEKVGQDKFFDKALVFSAATSLPKPTSKPDPAIYLYAMEGINSLPEECVAVEDSKSGTTSAVRAGIRTVGYVGSYPPEKQDEIARVLLTAGAEIIMTEWSQFDVCLQRIGKPEQGPSL